MPISNPIDNSETYISMRDVAARIAYLEFLDDPKEDRDGWEDEIEELAKLRALTDQVGDLDAQLIRDSAFTDYARDFAEDVYGRDNPLYDYVNWGEFVGDMQTDYTNVTFDGIDYWYHS